MIFQIIASIVLMSRITKKNDFFIKENEIIKDNKVIFDKREIVSIKKVGLLKVEIKYNKEYVEKVIYVTLSNKKLKEVKEVLNIFD